MTDEEKSKVEETEGQPENGGESMQNGEDQKHTAAAFAQQILGTESTTTKTTTPTADKEPKEPVVVKLRNKNKSNTNNMQLKENGEAPTADQQQQQEQQQQQQNGGVINGNGTDAAQHRLDGDTVALLQRTMGALYEMNPELEDSHEEIRKLDSQLDHLNDYMDRVEERLKTHNDKLMETLRQQREDRERRRQSFHERLEQSRQEDDDFQQQLSSVLSRVDTLRGRGGTEENGAAAESAKNGESQ